MLHCIRLWMFKVGELRVAFIYKNVKATWSVRGFLFLLQNHVIQYKLYLL